MPVMELVSFPGSKAFVADRDILKPALERICKAEGHISTNYGIESEDKRTGYLAIAWETYEHHMALIGHDDYETLVKQQLMPAFAGKPNIIHIGFNDDFTATLSAPTTEFAVVKLKPGNSKDLLTAQIKRLTDELNRTKVCHVPSVWGEITEDSETFIIAIGWDSVEAHLEAVKAGPLQSIINEMKALGDVGFTHTDLAKFES